MRDLADGNNFLEIRNTSITLWGLDIKPFEVNLSKEIKVYIEKEKIPTNEVCEIVENDIVELYKLCFNIHKMRYNGFITQNQS